MVLGLQNHQQWWLRLQTHPTQDGVWSVIEFQVVVCSPQRSRLCIQIGLNFLQFFFGVKCFVHAHNCLVKVYCDSSTAVAYINNLGGMVSIASTQFLNLFGNGALHITVF